MDLLFANEVIILVVFSVLCIVFCIALCVGSDERNNRIGLFVGFGLSLVFLVIGCILFELGKKDLKDTLDAEYNMLADNDDLSNIYSYHSFGKKIKVELDGKYSDVIYTYYVEAKKGKLYFYRYENSEYIEVELSK